MKRTSSEIKVVARTTRILMTMLVVTAVLIHWAPGREQAAAWAVQMVPASFAEVAAKASPAVVNISTEKKVKGLRGFRFPGPKGRKDPFDPFEEFFEKFFGDQMPKKERKETSLGSGFIFDPSGLIITNNHVVEGADDILVRMSDQREFHAEILGRDPKTDLALIRIKTKKKVNFPHLTLGDSGRLNIGDWVVAIGNPFGLEHTVTAGILSARGRAIGAGPYDDFLQTDASINPGNSGGPLLNMEGEVVGINTAIVAGGTGIGFAIPANMAKKIVAQLKSSGKVVRGWLGVMIQKITPELAKSFNLKSQSGALVADVTADGPADKAGLQRGDVIIEFNNTPIKEWSELPGVVADTPVGSKVKVVVIRDGREKEFTVKLGELKDEQVAELPEKVDDLGLTVRELTPEMAEKLGLTESHGVVITALTDGSPAEGSGLKPGDLIIEINREQIKDMKDYQRIVQQIKKDETVLFLVRRGPNTLFFTLEME